MARIRKLAGRDAGFEVRHPTRDPVIDEIDQDQESLSTIPIRATMPMILMNVRS